ncbi:MAG: flippase-like domain-containing protein [Bacilli bacterium]|nr:flippase-like domain-containing protein [Bacilli bacterium]
MASRIREVKPKKKKSGAKKYLLYFALVIGLTAASLFFSFYSAGEGNVADGVLTIGDAIISANTVWMAVIGVLVALIFILQGLIIQIFCRLYTRHYHLHQGVANALIGSFYNNVTPGSTGGQVMQVYTMKRQGIEVSNAASIMVMWFILYQFSLIIFDVAAITFEWNTIMSIKSITIPGFHIGSWGGEIPMLPLIIVGFVVNISVILLLFLMSYSRKLHNFIMHRGIGLGAKLKLIKNPDKTRENLRVQVENFKIELRRLQSNIPVTILVIALFLIVWTITFSIPYFSGLALDAFGYNYSFNLGNMYDFCFRSAFQQMVAGLVPLPGNAGVSELVFAAMFNDLFVETVAFTNTGITIVRTTSANVMAAQIIWRFSTYYFVLVISGLVASLYHSKVEDNIKYANMQTFVDLQISTYEDRKASSDTLYETKQLSRKEVRAMLGMTERNILQQKPNTWAIDTGDDFIGPLPTKKKRISREITVDDLRDD